jgi:membrane protein DedA with SNARE-associated domain
MLDLLRRPTAFVPLLISGGFLSVLLAGLLGGTLARQPDEGAAAHLFQILIPIEIVVIAIFAVHWLPKRAKPAAAVLALQGGMLLAVLAIVYFKNL